MRRRVPKLAIALGLGFPLLVAFTLVCLAADIRLNTTASLPLGLYIGTRGASDYISFCLGGEPGKLAIDRGYISDSFNSARCPGGGAALLKPIAARAGDRVTYTESGISVNGVQIANTAPRLVDHAGRPLPHYPFGRYTVAAGTFWVASDFDVRSYDSRYYGPVTEDAISMHVRPLWVSGYHSPLPAQLPAPSVRATDPNASSLQR